MQFVNSSDPQFELIKSIMCGNISNWAQLEIKAMLADVSLDDHSVYRIFEGITHRGAYEFTRDSLGKFQNLDSIVERHPSLRPQPRKPTPSGVGGIGWNFATNVVR